MQSIHCKVSLDDQYRRFLFKFSPSTTTQSESVLEESQFKKLQHQVRSLYGFGGDFVLKYKDDEGDHIIIECDEELNCAVAQSAGLLRLFIELKDEPMADATTTTTTSTTSTTTPSTTTTSTLPSEHTCPYHYGRFGHHGRGGRRGRGNGHWHDHHGNHGHGRGHVHGHCHGRGKHHGKRGGSRGMFNVEKLTSKRELISAVLNDPQVVTDEYKKLKLQRKLECINRRLAIANSTDQPQGVYESSSSSGDEKWRKKKCDKYNKKYEKCNKQRNTRRNLTEDEKVMLQILKTQIWELKPTLNTCKIQLCSKKAMKADAKNKGDMQRVEELKKEIQQLKEIIKEHKNALVPLKNQIFALKFQKQE